MPDKTPDALLDEPRVNRGHPPQGHVHRREPCAHLAHAFIGRAAGENGVGVHAHHQVADLLGNPAVVPVLAFDREHQRVEVVRH